MLQKSTLLSIVALLFYSKSIFAADIKPYMDGSMYMRLGSQYTTAISPKLDVDTKGRVSETNIELNPKFNFNFNNWYSVSTSWYLRDFNPDYEEHYSGARYFKNSSMAVEELYMSFHNKESSFLIGKYNPSFGTMWDETLGIWSRDLPREYQIRDKLGAAVRVLADAEAGGEHILQVNSFYSDNTDLSRSLFNNTGKNSVSDGGPSNTGRFSSYSVTLSGSKMLAFPGLTYNIGYANLAHGVDSISNEKDFVIGAGYLYNISDKVKISISDEFVNLKNFNTIAETTAKYNTFIAHLNYSNWNLFAINSRRNINNISDDFYDINQWEFSAAYFFESGIQVYLGRKVYSSNFSNRSSTGIMADYKVVY